MKFLIVDDEPLARENLRVLLESASDIEIVGECANAVEAIGAVHKLRPDVLFLDIQMPRISGLEMVGMLDPEHRPYIVFLTAFDEYAIKAFEEHAFDYLLKPIDEARLEKTLARLRQAGFVASELHWQIVGGQVYRVAYDRAGDSRVLPVAEGAEVLAQLPASVDGGLESIRLIDVVWIALLIERRSQ